MLNLQSSLYPLLSVWLSPFPLLSILLVKIWVTAIDTDVDITYRTKFSLSVSLLSAPVQSQCQAPVESRREVQTFTELSSWKQISHYNITHCVMGWNWNCLESHQQLNDPRGHLNAKAYKYMCVHVRTYPDAQARQLVRLWPLIRFDRYLFVWINLHILHAHK